MAPFFAGVAIGLALLVPAAIVLFVLVAVWNAVAGVLFAFRPENRAKAREEGRASARRWLAWMSRHRLTRWYPRLRERILGPL